MTETLTPRSELSSPFAARQTRSSFTSLEEAERDAVKVYYGSLTKRALVSWLVVLFVLVIMGSSAANAIAGTVLLGVCVAVLAYVLFEYCRKQRVFILDESFAVERRFSSDVELIRWTDVAKLYCVDRVTETRVHIYFVPVAVSKAHQGKLRIVLVDGREIVITNRVRDFSALAAQFTLRTKAVQLAPCTTYLIDGGTLDFDKFALTGHGLVYKRKLLGWNDIQQISVNERGVLRFKTGKLWRSPRFNTDAIPNVSLLLQLLEMFGGDVQDA